MPFFYSQEWVKRGGGREKFPLLKRGGGAKSFHSLKGGGAKSFRPANFPFCSPPLRVINDQSLSDNDMQQGHFLNLTRKFGTPPPPHLAQLFKAGPQTNKLTRYRYYKCYPFSHFLIFKNAFQRLTQCVGSSLNLGLVRIPKRNY